MTDSFQLTFTITGDLTPAERAGLICQIKALIGDSATVSRVKLQCPPADQ